MHVVVSCDFYTSPYRCYSGAELLLIYVFYWLVYCKIALLRSTWSFAACDHKVHSGGTAKVDWAQGFVGGNNGAECIYGSLTLCLGQLCRFVVVCMTVIQLEWWNAMKCIGWIVSFCLCSVFLFFFFFFGCGRVVNYSRWFCCRYIFSQLLLHEYLPLKSLFPKQKYITWLGAWGSILVPFFHIYHYGIKPYHVTDLLWNSKLTLECRLQYIIQNHMWKKAGESDALGIAIRPFVNTNQNLPSNNQENSPRERRAIQKPNNLFACFALPHPLRSLQIEEKEICFCFRCCERSEGRGEKRKKGKQAAQPLPAPTNRCGRQPTLRAPRRRFGSADLVGRRCGRHHHDEQQ